MKQVEFYFDLSSPWTYFAFHNIQPIVAEADASIIWKPFLVGGVFNAVNQGVYALRETPENPKMQFMFKSLKDWAAWSDLPLNFPSPYHPAKSVLAMRVCCALENEQALLKEFATAAFESYFVREENLDDPAVLASVANSIGADGENLVQQAGKDEIKNKLKENTQAVIDRGGFGSPTIFVNVTDMYFGNDQLPLVRKALERS